MRWNTPCSIGDAYSVTPVLDGTGAVTTVLMSVDTLIKWNSKGLGKGELTTFIVELKTVAA